jgi:hypothetical protein
MAIWRTLALRLLEQKTRNCRSLRLVLLLCRDRDNYSVYARWLGCLCRRISRYDKESRVPDEGFGSVCCLVLFAEAGSSKGISSGKQLDGSWITANTTPREPAVTKLPELS